MLGQACGNHLRGGVSIRARLCSRAMQILKHQVALLVIVSIRARLCSRAMRVDRANERGADRVSIRARLCSRAMPDPPEGTAQGRGFNPRPALQPGDAQEQEALAALAEVSIRARLCSRAMPICTGLGLVRTEVSIRARLCSRAMLKLYAVSGAVSEFQSAPGFAAGRCECPSRTGRRCSCFNPRPALQPGDARSNRDLCATVASFNPRPALQPGDAMAGFVTGSVLRGFQSAPGFAAGRCRVYPSKIITDTPVSIRARLCSRAMHMRSGRVESRCAVSIRARLCSRAMRNRRSVGNIDKEVVSIRARLCSRAMRLPLVTGAAGAVFQSAPGFAAGRCLAQEREMIDIIRFQSAPGFAAGRCESVEFWVVP